MENAHIEKDRIENEHHGKRQNMHTLENGEKYTPRNCKIFPFFNFFKVSSIFSSFCMFFPTFKDNKPSNFKARFNTGPDLSRSWAYLGLVGWVGSESKSNINLTFQKGPFFMKHWSPKSPLGNFFGSPIQL